MCMSRHAILKFHRFTEKTRFAPQSTFAFLTEQTSRLRPDVLSSIRLSKFAPLFRAAKESVHLEEKECQPPPLQQLRFGATFLGSEGPALGWVRLMARAENLHTRCGPALGGAGRAACPGAQIIHARPPRRLHRSPPGEQTNDNDYRGHYQQNMEQAPERERHDHAQQPQDP